MIVAAASADREELIEAEISNDVIESVRDVNALVASLVPGPRPAAPVR